MFPPIIHAPSKAIMEPYTQVSSTSYTAQILINRIGGFVPLIHQQNTQCYNYSLEYTFHRVPDVAVGMLYIMKAIYEFES